MENRLGEFSHYDRLERLLAKAEANLAARQSEIDALRGSATWRWSQWVLNNALVQGVFGRLIRAVAESGAGTRVAPQVPMGRSAADAGVQARAQEMISWHGFLGVPLETFELAGRSQLIALLNEDLRPESKVLDFGCGCLRIGWWLIRFLEPGCYYGIEPARKRVELGLEYLLTPEELKRKQPRFDFNPDFNSSVFGTKFDFFLARSIWTHASKPQIETTIDSFLRDSTAGAVFLASYFPAQSTGEDYQGDRWVGTSHECDTPGVIRHSLAWILEQCHRRGLQVTELPGVDCDSQLWLRVRRG